MDTEPSKGSLPKSKPPNRIDSKVPTQSSMHGRPSSGLSNLIFERQFGMVWTNQETLRTLFSGGASPKIKTFFSEIRSSYFKHVIGTLMAKKPHWRSWIDRASQSQWHSQKTIAPTGRSATFWWQDLGSQTYPKARMPDVIPQATHWMDQREKNQHRHEGPEP